MLCMSTQPICFEQNPSIDIFHLINQFQILQSPLSTAGTIDKTFVRGIHDRQSIYLGRKNYTATVDKFCILVKFAPPIKNHFFGKFYTEHGTNKCTFFLSIFFFLCTNKGIFIQAYTLVKVISSASWLIKFLLSIVMCYHLMDG